VGSEKVTIAQLPEQLEKSCRQVCKALEILYTRWLLTDSFVNIRTCLIPWASVTEHFTVTIYCHSAGTTVVILFYMTDVTAVPCHAVNYRGIL